jgi:hypothetical protein
LRRFVLGPDAPAGDYVVRLRNVDEGAPLSVRPRVERDPGYARVKGGLSADEPRITDLQRVVAAGGGLTLLGPGLLDDNAPGKQPRLFLGVAEVTDVRTGPSLASLVARVPHDAPIGTFPARLVTATGQVAPEQPLVEIVPEPAMFTSSESAGSSEGGEELALFGLYFRPGRMELTLDGVAVAVEVVETTDTTFRFVTPAHPVGTATFGLRDVDTLMSATMPSGSYSYVLAPRLNSVTPPFVPVLGGELVQMHGAAYAPQDRVLLERADGSFEDVSATQDTYVNEALHSFVAPVRAPGIYRVNVRDEDGFESPRVHTLTYFSMADLTRDLALDDADLGSVRAAAICDLDLDGAADHMVLASDAAVPLSSTSMLRLLKLTPSGFVDVTATAIPEPTYSDDWRACRVACIDVTEDDRPDLVLLSNDATRPNSTSAIVGCASSSRSSSPTGPACSTIRRTS